MKNITKEINMYRECVRNLWNVYFLNLLTEDNCHDLKDEYDDICSRIFSATVLFPFGCVMFEKAKDYQSRPEPLNFLKIFPRLDMVCQ